MALLASALSPQGFEKVRQIMEADEVLKATDRGRGGGGEPGGTPPGHDDKDARAKPASGQDRTNDDPARPRFGGPRPGGNGGAMFGKDLYYIAILGTRSEADPWMLQFGGHHLALNLTIAAERGILTPSLTGAQPSSYEANGKTVRPLAAESDKAVALINALDDAQRKQAILNYRVADLVLGPGHDGQTIQPEGLRVSTMNDQQRALLLDLVAEWADIVADDYAAPRLAEIKAGLADTWFAWSGPTTVEPGKNTAAYYRIQGPKLVIEFSPQPIGGDLTLHVHTMYRDPSDDYGRAVTAANK